MAKPKTQGLFMDLHRAFPAPKLSVWNTRKLSYRKDDGADAIYISETRVIGLHFCRW